MKNALPYRGRLAPSPTGYLHVGHALTFWRAQERSRARNETLLLRIEDLDRERSRPEFRDAILDDLEWFGLHWDDVPVLQSERRPLYLEAWRKLGNAGLIYRCGCSRRDPLSAAAAPHAEDEEPIYPGTCRPASLTTPDEDSPDGFNWRLRVPENAVLGFLDLCAGPQRAFAGVDFGDFVIWRKGAVPAYQLAVVVDDAAMGITEVVRGADLLLSTFRQLLLYRALGLEAPQFYHVPLVTDSLGKRLAKRAAALSLRALRGAGWTPEEIRARFSQPAAAPDFLSTYAKVHWQQPLRVSLEFLGSTGRWPVVCGGSPQNLAGRAGGVLSPTSFVRLTPRERFHALPALGVPGEPPDATGQRPVLPGESSAAVPTSARAAAGD